MIISRTPFRISFVGGGTDLKDFYEKEDGQVLSAAIDRYVYVAVKRQPDMVDYKYRITWSQAEFKNKIEDIEHPIVREALIMMGIDFPLEVTTFADVPASTGLGSSSSFAVGLLHALFALKGKMVTKNELVSMATKIEIDVLKRNIGKQDHCAAAYGDLNVFTFHKNEAISIEPVFYDPAFKDRIDRNLMMFFTGIKRDASEILKQQRSRTAEKFEILRKMKGLVRPLYKVISSGRDEHEFGRILHHGWKLKKSITDEISSSKIDEYYERAIKAGAIGGKLLGAGGGGFLLFYVPSERQAAVAAALSGLYQLNFRFDSGGTRITYYDQREN